MSNSGNEIKHILVIRLSAMGDVTMTVPVVQTFCNTYPNTKITFLSREFFKPFFDDIPHLEFYAADLNHRHKGFFGLIKLYKELKKLKIDAVADLHNVLRSKILRKLFRLAGIKVITIDKGRKEKKALTRKTDKIFIPLKTTHQRYADVFEKLGFDIDLDKDYKTPNPLKLNSEIENLIGNKTKKWIGIAPFAQYRSKEYPLDLLEKVLEGTSKKEDIQILLFGGGEKEISILETLQKKHPKTINIAGKLSFKNELILISNLDKMLSMDSGNGHLAAMLGIKVISLWGVTHPYAGFAPFHQDYSNSLMADRNQYPEIPCSVYGNKISEGYEDCMRSIDPEEIIQRLI